MTLLAPGLGLGSSVIAKVANATLTRCVAALRSTSDGAR